MVTKWKISALRPPPLQKKTKKNVSSRKYLDITAVEKKRSLRSSHTVFSLKESRWFPRRQVNTYFSISPPLPHFRLYVTISFPSTTWKMVILSAAAIVPFCSLPCYAVLFYSAKTERTTHPADSRRSSWKRKHESPHRVKHHDLVMGRGKEGKKEAAQHPLKR